MGVEAAIPADTLPPPAGAEPRRSAPPAAAADEPPAVDAVARPREAAALALVSQGVSSATNFLRLVFINRVCEEATVGVYALGMTIVLMMVAVHERLIETPYTVFANRRRGAAGPALLGSATLFSAGATVAASAVVLVWGAAVWLLDGASSIGPMLVIVGVTATPIVMRELARSAAFTHFRMPTAILIDTATLLLQAALLAAFWWGDLINVATLYAAVALSSAVAAGGWLWAWRGEWSINADRLAGDWRDLWSYSRWLVTARLMGHGSRLFVPWIVFAMLGEADAGFLATCASLVGLAWLSVRGVNNFFRPFVINAYREAGPGAVRRAVLISGLTFTACILPVCLLFGVSGDWLLVKIYGPGLTGGGMVVLLLGLNTLATSWAMAGVNGLVAIGRPRDSVWGEGLTLVATLAVSVPLIASHGLAGAAGAMLVGNVVGAGVALGLLERGLASAAEGAVRHA